MGKGFLNFPLSKEGVGVEQSNLKGVFRLFILFV